VIRRCVICDRNLIIEDTELEIFIWDRHIFKIWETINVYGIFGRKNLLMYHLEDISVD